MSTKQALKAFITSLLKIGQMVSDVCRGTDNYLVPVFVRESVIFLTYGLVNRIFMFLRQDAA